MKDRKQVRNDKKAYNAEANSEDSSSNSEGESDRDEEEISAYHMRIVRNSGYGYPMSGGNVDNVINQESVYYNRFNSEKSKKRAWNLMLVCITRIKNLFSQWIRLQMETLHLGQTAWSG